MNNHSRFYRSVAVLSIMLSLILTITPIAAAQDGDIAAEIENIMADIPDFNGVILVGVDGEIVFNEAYGFAVREWDVPNTVDTVFRIGSVTKQFTGMAILQLQEEGLLSVDDPICDYLDDCPDIWSDITIYHLLTHTSGIYDYTNSNNFNETITSPLTSQEVVDLFIDRDLTFEPGTRWRYSNSGYHLLGFIIEEASGTVYRRYITRLVEPLGLETTGLDVNILVIDKKAQGYLNATVRAADVNMNIPYAAGSMYSTAEDLFRWNQALYNGEVVSEASWDTMWDRAAETGMGGNLYAYGLTQTTEDGETFIWHGGGLPGFGAFNSHAVNGNQDIIILSNQPSGEIGRIIDAIDTVLNSP